MEYLKLFENHTEYQSFKQTDEFIKPNVSHCIQENEVHYNPKGYKYDYFTTVARENGTISFNIWKSMGTNEITSISYSTDNGETWNTTNNTNSKSEHLVITVNVSEGDKVLWKGDAQQLGFYDEDVDDIVGSFFSSDCEFDAQGNVMSLFYGDNFKGETTIENDYAFCNLFSDYDGEKNCGIVNAKDLSLPATTLTEGCYSYMFDDCTSLTAAPELPATALAQYCYSAMFYNCTSLTTAPELPATTLASNCYSNMFQDCTNLTTAPQLPATTLTNSCYSYMFLNCTSLTTAPELPATTLADSCYYGMFRDCTILNYIKCLAIDISAINCTINWVNGVASSGTFVKKRTAESASSNWERGVNGIPTGWTVENVS